MDKEKITGSAPSEYKDNLHGQPLEFYGEKFREADPQEIAARLHLPFQKETGELSVRFLGKTYKISHPDFHITMAESATRIFISPWRNRAWTLFPAATAPGF